MQATDAIRRNGYVVALAFALIAMFALMTGSGWTAAALVLAATMVIALVERLAAVRQRKRRPGLAAPRG
jgi:O-antigen ligase